MRAIPSGQSIREQLLSARSGVALCWLGNDSWLLRGQDRLIGFDLDLQDSDFRLHKPPVSAEELAPWLDLVFITHEHGDHFREATASVLVKQSKCIFVVPASCLKKARALGIPEDRLVIARPKQPFDLLGLHVEPVHAFHGHRGQTVHRSANMDDCGYLVTIAGRTVFEPGDSVLTQDHLALKGVDILFVSPTSHNMDVEPAARLVSALAPGWIFPQHFSTYKTTPENDFWTVGRPDELRQALPREFQARYHRLAQGDVFVIGLRDRAGAGKEDSH